jgi:membrane protein YdbS with pleckstrin-like domain
MTRIVFLLLCLAGIAHLVFFAGPQMFGVSPLAVIAFGVVLAAVTIPVEHRDHQRRQRKAALERARR